ncbi:uncharacterized protein LOC122501002 [Leptopilina heterotoma]|uniref:uncharacterized protein LOC122501002 n=1 Tax=Leptopilina heterotoma TaxID=63436 RepID=UPI001CA7FBF6|nr:uncharacterized protein LOC122501002 [Leptopilina heterotoma]XP_043466139.1 uncharacterized protein LOC122501002 [Leptopilina heterotoma]
MEKDQPDSLATVAVGSEKISPTSHYAPSEVYSTTEPPPAYIRPGKTTAVQIARIAAITLISMTVLLGSFILASSWIQARASCTPESIAAMQATLHFQKLHEKNYNSHQGEFLKNLQPAALIQDPADINNLQTLSASTSAKKEAESEIKEVRAQRQNENSLKNDNDNGDQDNDDEDDDYDDDELPPVHIKLPLQLDLDDIAGSLIRQARSRVSCVVERRRADEVMDGDNTIDNSTDPQRFQRVSGERVSILCEAGNPQQEQQDQEMMTPIIVPLGTVQIPVQPQEPASGYHQYQLHTQYQVPDMQQLPLSDPRGFNHIPAGVLPPELRNLPHINMEMKPPRMSPPAQSMNHQDPLVEQIEMRQIPIELRHFPLRGMRPLRQQEPRQEHIIAMNFPSPMYHPNEQGESMVPPPPPPSNSQEPQMPEHRMNPQMMPPQPDQRNPQIPQERPRSPLQGIPLEIRRIVQQVPMEIKNIIQHIMGDSKIFPVPVAEEARQEPKEQEFKPFPEGVRAISLGPFSLPLQLKNLLEHGSMEDRSPRDDESSEQQPEAKPFRGPEDHAEEMERSFPTAGDVRRMIHQVVEGRAMPVTRISLPLRAVDSIDIPVQARAMVTENQGAEQHDEQHNHEQQEQHPQEHPLLQAQPPQKLHHVQEENRPHYVQPRSVRSIPDELTAHPRNKRMRRSCACDCNCPNN